MNLSDLRLYLVTGDAGIGDEGTGDAGTGGTDTGDEGASGAGAGHVASVVAAAVAGGVTAVQLRAPGASTAALVAQARVLKDALRGTGVPLLVNNRLDVALAAGADGVHLGQDDLHPLDARAQVRDHAGFLIGWSITEPDQVAGTASWPEGTVDYLGVGPVHPTDSKADAAEPLGYDGLGEVCRRTLLPVVAIGGIGVGDVGACLAAGAVGVAVISAIWSAPDPQAAAAALRQEVDSGW